MRTASHKCASVLFLAAAVGLVMSGETPAAGSSETQLIERAQQLISASRLNEADHLLQDAVRLHPRSGGLYNLLGIVAAEQNQTREAEEDFLQAVRYSPTLVPALLNLARIFYGKGQNDAAIDTYRRALALNKDLEEAHANLAALFLDKGNYADAEQQIEALPSSVKTQNRFRAMACAALAGSAQLSRARQAAGEISGTLTEADVSLPAFVLAKLNQNDLALEMIKTVVERGSSRELRGLLASTYAKSGKPVEARAMFESLAKDDAKQTTPLVEAARVAYYQGDYEGAAGYLVRAIEIDKQNPQLQFFFGMVCIQLHVPGDAVQALREAVRMEPNNASFNYALGAASMSGENAHTAAAYFRKYVELLPMDPHGHLALGTAEFEAGDDDAALRELTPLLDNPAIAVGAHYVLGKLCRRQTNLEAAAEHFTSAMQLDPTNPALEANLASVHLRQGKLSEAKKELDRALFLDPDNYLANESLLLLMRKQKNPQAEQQAQRFAAVTQKASDEQQLLLRHIQIER